MVRIRHVLPISGRSLGQGTFGKVRIGTHTITHEQVAIKILEKDKIKDKSDIEFVRYTDFINQPIDLTNLAEDKRNNDDEPLYYCY